MPRQPKIYYSKADKRWHCWPVIGWDEEKQKPKRKHIKRATQDAVQDELDELHASLKKGAAPKAGKPEPLARILSWYLDTVVATECAYKTLQAYRPIIELRLIPELGHYYVLGTRNILQPSHVRALMSNLKDKGMADSYVRQHFRVLSRALKCALAEDLAARNVCTLIDGPKVRKRRRKPLPGDAPQMVIKAVRGEDDELRWLLALLSGTRQGETLGIEWDQVAWSADGETAEGFWTREQVQRRTWQHGCKDPAACVAGRKRRPCRTKQCRSWDHGCGPQPDANRPGVCGKAKAWACPKRTAVPCRVHSRGRGAASKKGCPPLCKPDCTKHASTCPKRKGGGLVRVDLKSEGSERFIPLDPYVGRLVRAQRARQARLRLKAGPRWQDSGLVFTGPRGQELDPRRDHERWEQILEMAGVADAALHAARHTAATLALDCGVDIATLQDLLGHTDIRTTRGYVGDRDHAKADGVRAVGARMLGGVTRT